MESNLPAELREQILNDPDLDEGDLGLFQNMHAFLRRPAQGNTPVAAEQQQLPVVQVAQSNHIVAAAAQQQPAPLAAAPLGTTPKGRPKRKAAGEAPRKSPTKRRQSAKKAAAAAGGPAVAPALSGVIPGASAQTPLVSPPISGSRPSSSGEPFANQIRQGVEAVVSHIVVEAKDLGSVLSLLLWEGQEADFNPETNSVLRAAMDDAMAKAGEKSLKSGEQAFSHAAHKMLMSVAQDAQSKGVVFGQDLMSGQPTSNDLTGMRASFAKAHKKITIAFAAPTSKPQQAMNQQGPVQQSQMNPNLAVQNYPQHRQLVPGQNFSQHQAAPSFHQGQAMQQGQTFHPHTGFAYNDTAPLLPSTPVIGTGIGLHNHRGLSSGFSSSQETTSSSGNGMSSGGHANDMSSSGGSGNSDGNSSRPVSSGNDSLNTIGPDGVDFDSMTTGVSFNLSASNPFVDQSPSHLPNSCSGVSGASNNLQNVATTGFQNISGGGFHNLFGTGFEFGNASLGQNVGPGGVQDGVNIGGEMHPFEGMNEGFFPDDFFPSNGALVNNSGNGFAGLVPNNGTGLGNANSFPLFVPNLAQPTMTMPSHSAMNPTTATLAPSAMPPPTTTAAGKGKKSPAKRAVPKEAPVNKTSRPKKAPAKRAPAKKKSAYPGFIVTYRTGSAEGNGSSVAGNGAGVFANGYTNNGSADIEYMNGYTDGYSGNGDASNGYTNAYTNTGMADTGMDGTVMNGMGMDATDLAGIGFPSGYDFNPPSPTLAPEIPFNTLDLGMTLETVPSLDDIGEQSDKRKGRQPRRKKSDPAPADPWGNKPEIVYHYHHKRFYMLLKFRGERTCVCLDEGNKHQNDMLAGWTQFATAAGFPDISRRFMWSSRNTHQESLFKLITVLTEDKYRRDARSAIMQHQATPIAGGHSDEQQRQWAQQISQLEDESQLSSTLGFDGIVFQDDLPQWSAAPNSSNTLGPVSEWDELELEELEE
ncbi:hypothetical protein B0T26DRAFT_754263 [Lasiosphaeria miniovina]|uniref:Uncharacterized protein n=1 Tax=Lasiosphaeria miniovina TaxID=1954250 RepID=A0AA40A474_9PEZI|nr:uncharacterized protein B0T26DRAFT_754263 [Lasiosphaeria miniovina]KAK0708983.1 hypothetical protein B0T26DRAFT_754263 [Lasiosphaeria miniovina]